MNRSRILRSSLLLIVALVVLMSAVVVVQGIDMDSSAAHTILIGLPRPHPRSHIKVVGPGSITRIPRPHPKSHIHLTATPIDQP